MMPELNIAADKVCSLIETLRELAGMEIGDPGARSGLDQEDGDDSADTGFEVRADDPRLGDVEALIAGLNRDERVDLVALALVGRGEFTVDEWHDAKLSAKDSLEDLSTRYVLDFITNDMASAEFLEVGLEAFGVSFAEWDSESISTAGGLEVTGPEMEGDIGDAAERQGPGQVANRQPRRHVDGG
jgi:hypothetical protein